MEKYLRTLFYVHYRNDSNNSNPPIIRTPPFPGKMIVYSNHSNTHVWNYYSNSRTPTPCGARTGIAKCLLASDSYSEGYRTSSSILQHFRKSTRLLQSFPKLLATVTVEFKRGLQTCTSLWQSLRSSNGGCQMCNSWIRGLSTVYGLA